jgi:hypothetical protein
MLESILHYVSSMLCVFQTEPFWCNNGLLQRIDLLKAHSVLGHFHSLQLWKNPRLKLSKSLKFIFHLVGIQ